MRVATSSVLALCALLGAPLAAQSPGQATTTAPSIEGEVRWKGDAPKNRKIRMSSDPYCERCCLKEDPDPRKEDTVVNPNGTLRDVVIHVVEGLPERAWPVPESAVLLDQKNCRFVPHVLALQLGQKLRIRNSDETSHNVHFKSRLNGTWNVTQNQPGTIDAPQPFKRPEIGSALIKCDQHPWMEARVMIFRHPFFAVTDETGHFEIRGLPAGTYKLRAWHKKWGTQDLEVTVSEKEPARADFSFEKKSRRRGR